MSRNDWLRLAMHLPVGLFPIWVYSWEKPLGLTLLAAVLIYEAFNDWRKCDMSYKDVLGIVWGAALGSIIWRLLCLI